MCGRRCICLCDIEIYVETVCLRGGGRTRGRSGDQGDARNDGLGGQVGGQGSEVNGSQGRGQGVGRNQNDDAVNDHIQGDVGNTTEGNDRMVASTEPKTIQKAMQLDGTLTDEAFRNGSIKKNHEKRGNEGEPSKDKMEGRITRELERKCFYYNRKPC
ncbi:hypothetical protein Tco_1473404 [Tanacetum coccineum]